MTISQHATLFAGKPVRDYSSSRGIDAPTAISYRLRQEYDEDQDIADFFKAFVDDPRAAAVESLVIGLWSDNPEPSEGIVRLLADARDRLPELRAIFIGDITFEECEISWLEQCDMAPVFEAYPHLEHFQVRGGNSLALNGLNLPRLKSLVVESGGLPKSVVAQIIAGKLPALEHLELWLGDDNYGGDTTVEDLRPILDGGLYPKLRTLGLRDSPNADEIAEAVSLAPVLRQIKVLDLSLGTLSDRGAKALLASPAVARLEKLDIHHHYLSKAMEQRLSDLGIVLDSREGKSSEDEEDRYIAVAE